MNLVAIIFLSLLLPACGTLKNGRGWGQDAVLRLEAKKIGRATHNAFFDLQTLIPAAGALLFALDDFDERISDWATKHNPIFGSEKDARDASSFLKTTLQVEAIVTALATPSGEEPKNWAYSKLKGLTVELVAMGVTQGATSLLKEATDRTRPDSSDNDSFLSAHASGAFSYSTLANRNIDFISMPHRLKLPLQVGNLVLATGVAWARVEGRRHYPSDVLAGAAVGHFLSAFIHDAFLGLPEKDRFNFGIFPANGGGMLQLSFFF